MGAQNHVTSFELSDWSLALCCHGTKMVANIPKITFSLMCSYFKMAEQKLIVMGG